MPRRLVCVVEGKGEVEALPNLCSRVRDYLSAWDWFVDPNPIKQPRGWLVDEAQPSPRRPCHAERASGAVQLALARPADGILLTCDSDDDCPAVWGPSAKAVVSRWARGDAVMVVREYETWLLHAFDDRQLREAGISDPERIRGAKEKLKRLVPRYKPTTHQLEVTRILRSYGGPPIASTSSYVASPRSSRSHPIELEPIARRLRQVPSSSASSARAASRSTSGIRPRVTVRSATYSAASPSRAVARIAPHAGT